MKNLENRLLYLATGELVAMGVFIYFYSVSELGMATLVALSILVFLLLQGTAYWFYRYRLISNRKKVSDEVIRILSALN